MSNIDDTMYFGNLANKHSDEMKFRREFQVIEPKKRIDRSEKVVPRRMPADQVNQCRRKSKRAVKKIGTLIKIGFTATVAMFVIGSQASTFLNTIDRAESSLGAAGYSVFSNAETGGTYVEHVEIDGDFNPDNDKRELYLVNDLFVDKDEQESALNQLYGVLIADGWEDKEAKDVIGYMCHLDADKYVSENIESGRSR